MILRIWITPNEKAQLVEDLTTIEKFDSEDELYASDICDALQGYIVNTDVVNHHKDDLIKALNTQNYTRFYKLVRRMAKNCLNELKGKER